MRRILYIFSQFVILAVLLGALYFLGDKAINGVRDLAQRVSKNRAQAQQLVIFPGTATAIAAINTKISYDKTHAPTATLSPTDDLGNPDSGSGGDGSNNPPQVGTDVPPPTLESAVP